MLMSNNYWLNKQLHINGVIRMTNAVESLLFDSRTSRVASMYCPFDRFFRSILLLDFRLRSVCASRIDFRLPMRARCWPDRQKARGWNHTTRVRLSDHSADCFRALDTVSCTSLRRSPWHNCHVIVCSRPYNIDVAPNFATLLIILVNYCHSSIECRVEQQLSLGLQ